MQVILALFLVIAAFSSSAYAEGRLGTHDCVVDEMRFELIRAVNTAYGGIDTLVFFTKHPQQYYGWIVAIRHPTWLTVAWDTDRRSLARDERHRAYFDELFKKAVRECDPPMLMSK